MPFIGGRGSSSRGLFGFAKVPDAPTSCTSSPGNGQLTIGFTAPAFNGGLPITNYEYALSTNSGATYGAWTALVTPQTTTPIVIPSLVNGTTYYVKIRAVNGIGSGAESAVITSNTKPYTTPGAPSVALTTDGEQVVTWTITAPNSNGGDPITNWYYSFSTDNGSSWTADTVIGVGTTTVSKTIQSGSTYDTNRYRLRVAGYNNAGLGGYSTDDNRSTAYTQNNYTVTEYGTTLNEGYGSGCGEACRSVRVTRYEDCNNYACGTCGFHTQRREYYKDKFRTRSQTPYRTRTAYRWNKGSTYSEFIGWVDANYTPSSGYTYPGWTYTEYGSEGSEYGPSACYDTGVCNENGPGNPVNGSSSPLGNWYSVDPYSDSCCNSGAWTGSGVWVGTYTGGGNRLIVNGFFGFADANTCVVCDCGSYNMSYYNVWRCSLTGNLAWTNFECWNFSCC